MKNSLGIRTFGERLRYFRKSSGFTQNNIAEALGVDRSTYTNYENDKTLPDAKMCATIANIYGITIDQLIGSERQPMSLYDVTAKRHDTPVQSHNLPDQETLITLSKEKRRLICLYRAATDDKKSALLADLSSEPSDDKPYL